MKFNGGRQFGHRASLPGDRRCRVKFGHSDFSRDRVVYVGVPLKMPGGSRVKKGSRLVHKPTTSRLLDCRVIAEITVTLYEIHAILCKEWKGRVCGNGLNRNNLQ